MSIARHTSAAMAALRRADGLASTPLSEERRTHIGLQLQDARTAVDAALAALAEAKLPANGRYDFRPAAEEGAAEDEPEDELPAGAHLAAPEVRLRHARAM